MLTEQRQAELLSGFGPWVASQPQERSYDYCSPSDCAFARYLRHLGYTSALVGSHHYYISKEDNTRYAIPHDMAMALLAGTFGGVANDLRDSGWLNGTPAKPVHLSHREPALTAGML